MGDFNGAGVTDMYDLMIWYGNKYTSSAESQGASSVPEPSGMALVCVGAALLLRRRKRLARDKS